MENSTDMLRDKTRLAGERNPMAKLSTDQVVEIIENKDRLSQTQLATKYDVTQSNISIIQSGVTWREKC